MAEAKRTKVCSACKQEKPLSKFGRRPEYRDGHRNQCNPCRQERGKAYRQTEKGKAALRRYYQRNKHKLPKTVHCPKATRRYKLKSKYGLTTDEYSSLLKSQNGRCAICETDDPKGRHGVFVVDHCHDTGRVRGLLCNFCNVAIGRFGDTPEALMRVVDYLRGDPLNSQSRNSATPSSAEVCQ